MIVAEAALVLFVRTRDQLDGFCASKRYIHRESGRCRCRFRRCTDNDLLVLMQYL